MKPPEELVKSIEALPTLPSIVARVNELVDNPDASAGDINELISKDLALSSKVLKLVNSAFYGFPRRISSVTHAVVILGFNTIRNIALSAFIFNAFKTKGLGFGHKEFWLHSIGTAAASNAIAADLRLREAADNAFVCGLLHDVGKVILHQFFKDDFTKVLQVVGAKGCLIVDAEAQVLGLTHADIGKALGERWALPTPIVAVIGGHHHPSGAGEYGKLVAIAHLADATVRAMMIGNGGDRRIPAIDPAAMALLGYSAADFPRLMAATDAEVAKAGAFVEMIL